MLASDVLLHTTFHASKKHSNRAAWFAYSPHLLFLAATPVTGVYEGVYNRRQRTRSYWFRSDWQILSALRRPCIVNADVYPVQFWHILSNVLKLWNEFQFKLDAYKINEACPPPLRLPWEYRLFRLGLNRHSIEIEHSPVLFPAPVLGIVSACFKRNNAHLKIHPDWFNLGGINSTTRANGSIYMKLITEAAVRVKSLLFQPNQEFPTSF